MGDITFVLGGARSGKSDYATKLTDESGGKTAYIATYVFDVTDKEMEERIKLHRASRPEEWVTFEEAYDLSTLLKKIDSEFSTVMIDCLTIFTSNLMLEGNDEAAIKIKINEMINVLKNASYNTFIVSNEVGLGIIPENALARQFRDIAGRVNQIVAGSTDNVYFVASGIPLKIK